MSVDGQQDDIFDYPMGDIFVSETRPRPYRTGFHSRQHPRGADFKYINALPEREFKAYIRNGCRLPGRGSVVRAELDEVRIELQELKAELRALRQAVTKSAPHNPSQRGGLNVAPRA